MSTTMNGFFAITATASARWAVSSGPLAVTRSRATVRPQSWKAPSFSAAYRYAALPVLHHVLERGRAPRWPGSAGPLAEAGPSIWVVRQVGDDVHVRGGHALRGRPAVVLSRRPRVDAPRTAALVGERRPAVLRAGLLRERGAREETDSRRGLTGSLHRHSSGRRCRRRRRTNHAEQRHDGRDGNQTCPAVVSNHLIPPGTRRSIPGACSCVATFPRCDRCAVLRSP